MKCSWIVCVAAVLASACTPLPEAPPPEDSGSDSADAGPRAPRAPSRIVASGGQVEGRSEHYRVQLSASM
ncbi:MAG TPA: hypothetical protein VJR89_31545, partial [Polyangiales bacterium]|nr:hypothetical protein [Polyangiales bacterium]